MSYFNQSAHKEHDYTMTLSELISSLCDAMKICDESTLVMIKGFSGFDDGIGGFCSWRGSYDKLCITPGEEGMKLGEFILQCKDQDGAVYTGYKGGEFKMWLGSDIWIDHEGSCSEMGLKSVTLDDGVIYLMCEKTDY